MIHVTFHLLRDILAVYIVCCHSNTIGVIVVFTYSFIYSNAHQYLFTSFYISCTMGRTRYIYIYIYMYICTYIYTYVYMYIYIHIWIMIIDLWSFQSINRHIYNKWGSEHMILHCSKCYKGKSSVSWKCDREYLAGHQSQLRNGSRGL
jgi:hypothetical protein